MSGTISASVNPRSRIRELWAIVAVSNEGGEALVQRNAFGHWYPLVTADPASVPMLEAMAKEMLGSYPGLRTETRHFSTDDLCRVITAGQLAVLGGIDGR